MLPSMKLGKLPPKHDLRIPMLAKFTTALPPAPASIDWSGGVKSFGMMLNDHLGDCTCAAVGHAIQTWTLNAHGTAATLADPVIETLYEKVGGYVPDDDSTDNGAVETDVLSYWLKTPVNGHALEGYAALQPKDIHEMKDAIWLFGGVYIGVALPSSAQAQVGGVWTVPMAGLVGDGAPGSWGGHAVYVVAYDSRGLTCITWGKLQRMSWNFWWAYCDEAYGLLSPDWFAQSGKAPAGFDLGALKADMAALKKAA